MPRSRKPPGVDPEPGVQFGWQVHGALQDWTNAVDQKASIVLVFATALGGFAAHDVFALDGGLHHASGARLWVVRLMAVLFALAGLLALSVVLPRLRRRATEREAPHRLIFFGHLRHRSAAGIEHDLLQLTPAAAVHQLALQVKDMSRIAWVKHARLQAALVSLVLATAAYALARLVL